MTAAVSPRSRLRRQLDSARRPVAAAACVLLCAVAAAGCGSAASRSSGSAPSSPTAATLPLTTSLAAASGSWAVLVMGGSAADENNFWQLFDVPSGGTQWSLVTPPAVADNGGLVVTPDVGGTSQLRVAFRPSQDLTFTPLTSTSDNGRTWNPGLLNVGIAAVPDALAARGATVLALLADGAIDESATGGTNWTTLARSRAIAASAAGSRCRLTAVTAVSLSPSGTPLAGAACAKAGSAGIFAYAGGTWQATGPALAGQPTRVIRLTSTSAGNTALISTGTGRQERLFAAWTSEGTKWTVSAPLPDGGAQVRASGTGTGGSAWVMLGDGRAVTIAGPGAAWHVLPSLPAGTAALAVLPGGAVDALAVAKAKLTVYRLAEQPGTWTQTQVIKVPIQYGSSS